MTPETRTSMTPRLRSVFQALTASVTGVVTFGSLAATGWLAGQQAKDYEHQGSTDAGTAGTTASVPTPAPNVVAKRRPHRTEIRTVYVPAGGVVPGSGGTVQYSAGGSSGGSSGNGSGGSGGSSGGGRPSSGGGPAPAPAPTPAPAPAPAPAPSSGS